MKDVSSYSLQQARMDCDNAFVNFFKSKNDSRKGQSGFPKFKSKKDNHQSYREPNVNGNAQIHFEDRFVKIAKLGKVVFKDRSFPKWWNQIEKLCSMTISLPVRVLQSRRHLSKKKEKILKLLNNKMKNN